MSIILLETKDEKGLRAHKFVLDMASEINVVKKMLKFGYTGTVEVTKVYIYQNLCLIIFMILTQAMAKKLKVKVMFFDITALETAQNFNTTETEKLQKKFRCKCTMLEHVALNQKKTQLLQKILSSIDDYQVCQHDVF